MKTKLLILTLFIISFFSCTTSVNEKKTTERMNGKPITIIEFDGCEYVGFYDGSGHHYTHKGNCKYCIKRNLK